MPVLKVTLETDMSHVTQNNWSSDVWPYTQYVWCVSHTPNVYELLTFHKIQGPTPLIRDNS